MRVELKESNGWAGGVGAVLLLHAVALGAHLAHLPRVPTPAAGEGVGSVALGRVLQPHGANPLHQVPTVPPRQDAGPDCHQAAAGPGGL